MVVTHGSFNFYFSIECDTEHHFMCLFAMCISSLMKYSFISFTTSMVCCSSHWVLKVLRVHILIIGPSPEGYFVNIFSCLWLVLSFSSQCHLKHRSFKFYIFVTKRRNLCHNNISPMFSPKDFIVLSLNLSLWSISSWLLNTLWNINWFLLMDVTFSKWIFKLFSTIYWKCSPFYSLLKIS